MDPTTPQTKCTLLNTTTIFTHTYVDVYIYIYISHIYIYTCGNIHASEVGGKGYASGRGVVLFGLLTFVSSLRYPNGTFNRAPLDQPMTPDEFFFLLAEFWSQ